MYLVHHGEVLANLDVDFISCAEHEISFLCPHPSLILRLDIIYILVISPHSKGLITFENGMISAPS